MQKIPDNWIFCFKIGYIGSLQFGCYCLQYVPASKPFDDARFEVLEAITLYCTQRQRQEYAGPMAYHDRAGPEYRYLDWYATANTDYVDYGTKDIQVLH